MSVSAVHQHVQTVPGALAQSTSHRRQRSATTKTTTATVRRTKTPKNSATKLAPKTALSPWIRRVVKVAVSVQRVRSQIVVGRVETPMKTPNTVVLVTMLVLPVPTVSQVSVHVQQDRSAVKIRRARTPVSTPKQSANTAVNVTSNVNQVRFAQVVNVTQLVVVRHLIDAETPV